MIVSIAALGFVTIPDDPSRMSVMVNVKLPTVFSGVDALSTALGVVLVLMVAPATIYRFVATRPDTVPAVDDELLVMAFNNENGYDTDGNFNGHCFAKAVRDTAADFVSVPEGDAMVRKVSSLASVLPCYERLRRRRNCVVPQHFNTANRDALEWVASDLSCERCPQPAPDSLALTRLCERQTTSTMALLATKTLSAWARCPRGRGRATPTTSSCLGPTPMTARASTVSWSSPRSWSATLR